MVGALALTLTLQLTKINSQGKIWKLRKKETLRIRLPAECGKSPS
jgi:hypothetical protein